MSPAGKAAGRKRLDVLLTERGHFPSREKAQAAILAGLVRVGGVRVDKPGTLLRPEVEIALEQTARFVGRGGEKLDGALDRLGLDVSGARALDVGASTGGFTDCLLQRGASTVVALDVGRGQLDWKIRTDPRVLVIEGVNARYLDPASVPSPFDLVVVDVSFISLRLVLPVLFPLLRGPEPPLGGRPPSQGPMGATPGISRGPETRLSLPLLLALVKPQFEAGREKVGRRGVVTDPEVQIDAIVRVASCADGARTAGAHAGTAASPLASGTEEPIRVLAIVESPLRGAEGNREFFLAFGHGGGLEGEALAEEASRVVLGEGAAP